MIKNHNAEGIYLFFTLVFLEKICVNQFNLSNLCSDKKSKQELLFF